MQAILTLREKRNKLWETAKNLLDTNRSENGTVPTEIAETYDKMEAEMVNLGKEIDRLERQAAHDAELNKETSAAVTNVPAQAEAQKTGRAASEYEADFKNVMRGKRPLHNVLSTDPDADGGYLVPTEFENRIIVGLDEANVVRKISKVIKTAAERKIPVAVTHSTAKWTAENAQIPESNPTFGQKTLDAFKLTNLIRVSTELLQDSMFNLETYLADEFARAFGVAEEEAFCVGTGVEQPTGIFTENGGEVGVTVGANINTDALIDLVYALKSSYRRNAAFLMKDTTVSAIRKLKDNNGAYLWQPSVQAGEPDRLLGYPLHTSPYVPTAESGALPVAFGDYSYYWIADRLNRTVQRLVELYAGNGQIGFIGTQRVDAKVILPEGIKLLKMGT